MSHRLIRAIDQLSRYTIAETTHTDIYIVTNGDKYPYKVDFTNQTCTCKDYQKRNQPCKHYYMTKIHRYKKQLEAEKAGINCKCGRPYVLDRVYIGGKGYTDVRVCWPCGSLAA